ncbi:MAG: esterase/lipase family protein [Spongiibacter marinus]|uniref:esterase/lipase family protein n=1 Tax=Spongiibacter marinus TaxID=354246 RepID=UPI003C44E4C6
MKTGKVLHGAARLAFDSVDGVNTIVEQMYRNISATPLPFGRAPEGPAPGIAGLVHRVIRGVNGGVRSTTDVALSPLTNYLDGHFPPGPHRAAVIAALNGVCGDHLHRSGNPLATPMTLRVMLGPDAPPSDAPGAALFETCRRSVEIYPSAAALSDSEFTAGGHILLLAHGLCMNELEWTAKQHNHGHMLAKEYGYSPVFVRYNSGKHISQNGRELAQHLEGLVERWPVPVQSITAVGFSMGGLVLRSAMHSALEHAQRWPQLLDKVVYIGTPHHGSALERGGYWLQRAMAFSPYTAPLAALGRIRSDGITDLRHGNIVDADWQLYDEHQDNADHRVPLMLPPGIDHYAIAGTLSRSSAGYLQRSDGLVHPDSALGRHPLGAKTLGFAADRQRVFCQLDHLSMLSDARVADQLKEWLRLS